MKDRFLQYDNGWLADEDRLGRQTLLLLLLSGDDSDGYVAEPAALELARSNVARRDLAAAAQGRRVLPERRHLRR